ncbi:response regulator [Candidatus Uhrbacteria bacterium]|nr:response regulator [Candidatus Uhrbacteria bacterium]
MVKKERFDLILLDLVIPRLDGFGVLGALKEERNSPPVIVLTNLSQTEDRDRAIKLGAKDFFVKSNTTIAQIVERVRELLK